MKFQKHFNFVIACLALTSYVFFELLLSLDFSDIQYLYFHKLKMVSALISLPFLQLTIYQVYFPDGNKSIPFYYILLSPFVIAFSPFDIFTSYPVSEIIVNIQSSTFVYHFGTTNIIYSIFAVSTFLVFLFSSIYWFVSKSKSKRIAFLYLNVVGIIICLNEFLLAHGFIDSIMIVEYFLFSFVFFIFIEFLNEDKITYISVLNLSKELQKHKEELEIKVKERTKELVEKSKIIEAEKLLVQEKNEQIYGSIRYASTIQHAILPWDTTLRKSFDKYFIFYLPKDIVSGDSYWFKEVEGIKFLAVIDCTGHGIPGSMLTVIASAVLDDAVLGKLLKNTGEILTYMNDKVTEVLNQRLKENEVRDGMEVALIAIHSEKIQFSGAGRPLYLKHSSFEILKTDRRAIAGRAEDDHYIYSSVEIERNCNLMLYLTTDGYADQMNEDGKKYGSRHFLSLLESIADKPLSEQQQLLEQELTKHQGDRNQIDDITIIGIQI
jgi:serine phosphatase RsbU (regulator of sigma subunit)